MEENTTLGLRFGRIGHDWIGNSGSNNVLQRLFQRNMVRIHLTR